MRTRPSSPASPPPRAAFARKLLADQITENLRAAILSGEFSEVLPSERKLAALLHASRPIVHQALHRLRKEGLLRIRPNRAATILPSSTRRAHRGAEKRVVLLGVEFGQTLPSWSLRVIDEIRRELYEQGVHFDVVMEPRLRQKHPEVLLEKLTAHHRAEHWILAGVPAPVQAWFRGQPWQVAGMGHAFPPVHFPFVNDDLRAVTRHAGGVFLGLGHRRIAFLMRGRGSAGEAQEEGGFREACQRIPGAHGQIVKHSGSVEAIRRRLPSLFRQPAPITALLVSHADDTLVVSNWFLENGIRVPQDVSFISFQWESFLDRLRPMPAWYFTDPRDHARKLCRLVLHPPHGKWSPKLVMPAFRRNGALAPPRSRP